MISLLLGVSEILSSEMRARRVSDTAEESRARGRFRRNLVLLDSVAPSPVGPITIREAWVEVAKRTRLGMFPRETGWEHLVLRIDTNSGDVYFLVQGVLGHGDTVTVQQFFRAGPRVRTAQRADGFPDTLQFLAPAPRRGRGAG